MHRKPIEWSLAGLLALALLAAGCAAAPGRGETAAPAPSAGCAEIAAAVADAQASRQQASEQEQGAWKVVVPFAVAARYASAKSAGREADQRLRELDEQARAQGCDSHED